MHVATLNDTINTNHWIELKVKGAWFRSCTAVTNIVLAVTE